MASSSIKRQRKRKRLDSDGDPEFQVAPMVDVLLVLMLFFMAITSTETLKKDPNLILPEANHGQKPKPNENKHMVTINIGWDKPTNSAIFNMNGLRFPTADALSAPLITKRASDPQMNVLIRADQDVQYSNVADLMNACAAAGVATVTFSVINNPNKKGAAAAPDASAAAQ
jgi:biopolymer transport protein ExbD